MNKKLKKLFRDPKLFFKDFIFKRTHKFQNKHENPRAVKGKHSFIVIAPTFNVEKYIEEFFYSIKNQTLSFENNIHVIFVDDGSTDSTSKIIEGLCKKFPNNITYLYKENGGLSSSRNYGLDYIDNNDLKYDYLTFTDPDDVLDKNYFLELDKFFTSHPECKIASCNLIYYYEHNNTFRDIHPLKYRYSKTHTVTSLDFKEDVLLSAATSVYKTSLLRDIPIRFNEKLKPSFEDCQFNNKLIVSMPNIEIGFIKEAKYFYRQREDNSSLMNGSWEKEGLFTTVLSDGVINILQFSKEKLGYIPLHIQRVALFHCIGYYRRLLNNNQNINFLTESKKEEFDKLLFKVFSYIDEETIIKCTFPNIQRNHKIGLFSLYKNKRYPISYININRIDTSRKVINLSLFTGFVDDKIKIKIDNIETPIIEDKLVRNTFLSHDFFYERRFTIKYDNASQHLDITVNDKKANVTSFTKGFTGGDKLSVLIDCMNKKFIYPSVKDSWVIMDRKDKADDNAEHFYRYIMKNHPEEQIFFALQKDSSDWDRLSKDGFNLLDFNSSQFLRELKLCKYIVSSHLFIWNCLTNEKGPQSLNNKRKIWLQHGVICNDNSNVVNTKEIDLMITSTIPERNSIIKDLTRYNLLPSQVILTGLPRHDVLKEKALINKSEKIILVMPTWRTWINQEKNFLVSDYFKHWNSLLESEHLHALLEKHGYKLIFAPHKELKENIAYFYSNSNIIIWNDTQESMQDLFIRAEAMITDYSSVAFEMGFLHKPVFYFQFDQNEFYSKHYRKGYFDFYNDGFGPVIETEETLINQIDRFFKNKEEFVKKYQERMDIFNHSTSSCAKIFDAIRKLT